MEYNIVEAIDQPGNSSKVASVVLGNPERRREPKFAWTARSSTRTIGSSPASALLSACCCHCRSWGSQQSTILQALLLSATPMGRRLDGERVLVLKG